MRIEVEWWWKQADRDLEIARKLLDAGLYEGVAYHSHQAAEKALKTLIINMGGWHLTHSCKFMLGQIKSKGLRVEELYC